MTEKKIGYARAATPSEIDTQVARLKAHGCVEVFVDTKEKNPFFNRPGLKAALAALQSGDTLVVCAVNRLARDTGDVLRIIERMMSDRIEFESLDNAAQAHLLQHRVNYAPAPTPHAPIRYAFFRMGQFLIRHSRRGLSC